jgi:hypothetical protein
MDIRARGFTAGELRLAARRFRRQPIVTAATLIALAVGIGMMAPAIAAVLTPSARPSRLPGRRGGSSA